MNTGYVSSFQQPTRTSSPYQEEINSGLDWAYFKTASCIIRIIIFMILLVCVVLLAQAGLLNLIISLGSGEEDNEYITVLNALRICYITFGSFLMSITVIKIALNIARFGDYKRPRHMGAKVLNIAINVFEGILYVTFIVTAAAILITAFYLILDPACATAIGLVIPCAVFRAILGCVECCCVPSARVSQEIVIIQPVQTINMNK